MKNSLSIFVLVWATSVYLPFAMPYASAQTPYLGGQQGGQVYEPGAFRAVEGELGRTIGWPGRIWVSANYADRGLGYRGSYLTIGTKTRLFEDFLDGRWLCEARGHVSEEGGFFANLGIERIFSVDAAGADISLGGWFDYDDDQGAFEFADTHESWGATAKIKTRHWDVIANGYFSLGTSDNLIGTLDGSSTFFQNSIVLTPGIDSALTGFDVTLRTRPSQLAFINGSFDFGGYGYESDLVEFFGGGRVRLNFQMLRGMIVSGEVNYDDRFDVTGVVGVTLQYGANARGAEYAGIAKDLETTSRNDHIVRFNQDVVLAIDPDTGAAYNVLHVDNTADESFEDGTFERRFTSLADAEAASGTDDIIFVHEGDETTRNLDTGIVLKDGQLLLGDGVEQLIPIQGGVLFRLSTDLDGVRPTITASNNGNAVTLASRNTVRGFVIDGAAAPDGMANGIFGGILDTNTDGIIEDNLISGAILNGVGITNLAGDWTFSRNTINDNGFSGISLVDACDPTSVFTFDSNIIRSNGLDGIQMINYDAAELVFRNNITDNNGRDGVHLENFKGDPGVGIDILFDGQISRFNNGAGVSVIGATGNLTVINSTIGDDIDLQMGALTPGGNLGFGINVVDFQTPGPNDRVLIMDNSISGNGVGGEAGLNVELNEGFTRVLVTGNVIDGNGVGIRTRSDDVDPLNGTNSILDIDIVDNISIGGTAGGNLADGLRFIAVGGSSQDVFIDQAGAPLQITGSGVNGITFLSGNDSGGALSNLTAIVRNVSINGSGTAGVFGSVVDDGQLSLLFENSIVNTNGTGFIFALDTNENQAVNTIIVQNNTVDNSVFGGFNLTTGDGTFTDLALINNAFTNTFLLPIVNRPVDRDNFAAGFVTDGVLDGVNGAGLPDGGFADGISITATGDADILNPQVDNRTRLFIQGNTVDKFTLDGLVINTFGDASVLAIIDSNTITDNGDGFENTPITTQQDLPFFDGLALNSFGSSTLNARVTNNFIFGSAEFGGSLITNGSSTINALFNNNNMAGNDVTDDDNTAVNEANGIDFVAVNGLGSNMALSFTNNFLDLNVLTNLGAMADFSIELDGLSNGPVFAVPFPGNIAQPGFGTVVEPLIQAEETAYAADGFPAEPPPILFP